MAQKGDNRTQFKLYKEDVQRRGKPFFPYAMFHDTVMSFVVVSVIIALAAIWYFTSGPEAGDSGVLGPRYAEVVDGRPIRKGLIDPKPRGNGAIAPRRPEA